MGPYALFRLALMYSRISITVIRSLRPWLPSGAAQMRPRRDESESDLSRLPLEPPCFSWALSAATRLDQRTYGGKKMNGMTEYAAVRSEPSNPRRNLPSPINEIGEK